MFVGRHARCGRVERTRVTNRPGIPRGRPGGGAEPPPARPWGPSCPRRRTRRRSSSGSRPGQGSSGSRSCRGGEGMSSRRPAVLPRPARRTRRSECVHLADFTNRPTITVAAPLFDAERRRPTGRGRRRGPQPRAGRPDRALDRTGLGETGRAYLVGSGRPADPGRGPGDPAAARRHVCSRSARSPQGAPDEPCITDARGTPGDRRLPVGGGTQRRRRGRDGPGQAFDPPASSRS